MRPVSCIDANGKGSFGGSQMWWGDKVLVNSGCGIVAGFDSLLHMKGVEEIDRAEYIKQLTDVALYIRPMRLPFWKKEIKVFGQDFVGSLGVSFPGLKRGLRKLIRNMGLNARVKSYKMNFVARTKQVLQRDIPVILLIRAPFGNVRMLDSDTLKQRDKLGQHYVTVTGFDEDNGLFEVSSWGRKYKIDPNDLKKFSVVVRFCYLERHET